MQNGNSIIRVKIVISKQELEALLSDRSINETSMEQTLLQLHSNAENAKEDYAAKRCEGLWRPSLESIPEIS